MIAELANKKVVFEIPNEIESSGYSKATKARLDGRKIKKTWMESQVRHKKWFVKNTKSIESRREVELTKKSK